MRIEKWNYEGKEINIPIFEEIDIETNETIEDDIDNTKDISELLNTEDKKDE